MAGEADLERLLKDMTPELNKGEYVFITTNDLSQISRESSICEFKEKEGTTVVIERKKADELQLKYDFISSWITLKIHSSLEAVGLTAAFSKVLTENDISCNVIAG
ncbi:MAG: ACT domain-containing protein, partial [Leeuwenhoekiella sp.]